MRRNKHNAQKVEKVVGGAVCRFDSLAEWRYAEWLERQRRSARYPRIVEWEHHPEPVELLSQSGQRLGVIAPDFGVTWSNSDFEYHEVKGMATAMWRWKRRHFEADYGAAYVVIDAGRGVCRTGEGEPAMFDERPKRKRRAKK